MGTLDSFAIAGGGGDSQRAPFHAEGSQEAAPCNHSWESTRNIVLEYVTSLASGGTFQRGAGASVFLAIRSDSRAQKMQPLELGRPIEEISSRSLSYVFVWNYDVFMNP